MSENKEVEESYFVQIKLTFNEGKYVASVKIPQIDEMIFDGFDERDDSVEMTRFIQVFNAVRTGYCLKRNAYVDHLLESCLQTLLPTYPIVVDKTDVFGLKIYPNEILVYRLQTGKNIAVPKESDFTQMFTVGNF